MIKSKLERNLLSISLLIIYIPLFKYYIELNNNKGHSFMTADWLINYNYGFINRGFIGTLFINITNNPEILLDIISIVLISIYALIFYFLNKIFLSTKQNFISIILIFSPASFLFPIYDSQGAFRKEILGILALLILGAYSKTNDKKFLYWSTLTYTVAIFSHTVNFFFLTTIFFILFKIKNSKKIKDYLLFVIPTILYISLYFMYSSTESELYEMRDSMCLELRELGLFNLCGHGSFDFIVWDLNAAYLITQNIVINERRQEYYFYILLFLISLIPYFFDKKFLMNAPILILIGLSFIPLFLLAFDWGRWIYIMSVCFLVVYLLSDKTKSKNIIKYLLIAYPFLFRIEHCCDPIFIFNYEYFLNNLNYLGQNFLNIIN